MVVGRIVRAFKWRMVLRWILAGMTCRLGFGEI
jgi:hypothetical protein